MAQKQELPPTKTRCNTAKFWKKEKERRREDVEPTIGDIKRNMNFRTFNLRGKPKCLTELGLVSIGHNFKKIKSWIKKSIDREDGREKIVQLGTILGYLPNRRADVQELSLILGSVFS